MTFEELLWLARKRGFLPAPCPTCDQRMIVSRSGRLCLNCASPTAEEAPE